MADGELRKTYRRLPHWRLDGATYFITFRLFTGQMSQAERRIVLDHICAGHGQYYTLIATVVMPDHVHSVLEPADKVDLSRIMKGMKGASARLINRHRQTTGSVWQEESWDRILRDQAELDEKLQYMLNNPVKKGLIADGLDWDGWYYNVKT